MEQRWNIQLLGGLRAARGAATVDRFPTYKTGALLAYLAYYSDRAHPRDVLIEIFWPESSIGSARNSLSVALSFLRTQLRDSATDPDSVSVVIADRRTVRLDPSGIEVDTHQFESAILQALRGKDAPEQAAADTAATLHRGQLLPGYYEDWVIEERDRLSDLYLRLLNKRIQELADLHRYEEALPHAHRALQLDPLREASHRTLMRLYAASGRHAAALEQYANLEKLLQECLRTTPASPTLALVAQIHSRLAGARAPQGISALPGPEGFSPPILPARSTRYFGREREIQRLRALVTDGDIRLVTITGLGGIGKTRLAIEAAAGLVDSFSGRLWFVELAELEDSGRLLSTIQESLDLPKMSGLDPIDQIRYAFAGRKGLIVLDNFEQLADSGAVIIGSLLERCPDITVLVTSRHTLGIMGEQEMRLHPLPLPQGQISMEKIAAAPSVQLFVDRVRSRRPALILDSRTAKTVRAICAQLEGIPLALELAAAWAGVLTPEQILVRLQRQLSLLVDGPKDLPERHRSLRASIGGSFSLLSPELQRLAASLAVFRGGWTLQAATRICWDSERIPVGEDQFVYLPTAEDIALDCHRSLEMRSLLTVDHSDTDLRYRMLDVVRVFATERMDAKDADNLARRHAEYFANMVQDAARHFRSGDQALWLDRLETEHENVRAALTWAVTEDPALATRMALGLVHFWLVHGHLAEAKSYLAAIVAVQPTLHASPATRELLAAEGQIAMAQGDYSAARHHLDITAAACREHGDQPGLNRALGFLAEVQMNEGHFGAAQTALEAVLSVNQRMGFHDAEADNLAALGYIARERGDLRAARSLLERAVALYTQLSDPLGEASSRGSLAHAVLGEGDWQYAEALLGETLDAYRRLANRAGQAWVLTSLADIGRDYGSSDKVEDYLREALCLNQDIGNRAGEAWCLESLGSLVAERGSYAAGMEQLETSYAISVELGSRSACAKTKYLMGKAALKAGYPADARSRLSESLTETLQIDAPKWLAIVLSGFAELLLAEGSYERAAILIGHVESLRGALVHANQRRWDDTSARARQKVGESAFDSLYAHGRDMPVESVLAIALESAG